MTQLLVLPLLEAVSWRWSWPVLLFLGAEDNFIKLRVNGLRQSEGAAQFCSSSFLWPCFR